MAAVDAAHLGARGRPTRHRHPTGVTIWFTGLPCAGKSTLANMLSDDLRRRGRNVELLDGDLIRTTLSKGLGFSKEDRDTNIMRMSFVANLLSRNGVVCVVAAVSPYREARARCRAMIRDFVEIHVDATVDACVRRDVKGMYRKAVAGEITGFTGVDDPYEEPEYPDLVVETDKETVEESVNRIFAKLIELGYLEPEDEPEDESRIVTDRLAALGYL